MSEDDSPPDSTATESSAGKPPPAPLTAAERRILGVLMEKARTTPDAYPLSLNGLVTGCNQKSNRAPLMDLTSQEVEDALLGMRQKQLAAEVHSGGRVPKFRHYGYDYMGVKGVEAAVMTELLLRGQQTIGDLRLRASRFEPIPDLTVMQQILGRLMQRGLVVALTSPGRGQLISHGLYEPHEMESLVSAIGKQSHQAIPATASSTCHGSSASSSLAAEVSELRELVDQLVTRVEALENRP